jgi:hypothetical protein
MFGRENMTSDDFEREAAALSLRWALQMRAMGYLHAAAELDDAAERLYPLRLLEAVPADARQIH